MRCKLRDKRISPAQQLCTPRINLSARGEQKEKESKVTVSAAAGTYTKTKIRKMCPLRFSLQVRSKGEDFLTGSSMSGRVLHPNVVVAKGTGIASRSPGASSGVV